MPSFRTWTWTRIDGRNVLAMPTRNEIHLYDSEDFILLDTIAPTGHQSYIQSLRWSAFHGKLASLSSTQIIVHAPQLVEDSTVSGDGERVRFVRICDFDLRLDCAGMPLSPVRSISFSRCADYLLLGGGGGLGMLDICAESQLLQADDIRLSAFGDMSKKLVWRDSRTKCDIVKLSPCSFVFATFTKGEQTVKVWRMARRFNDGSNGGDPGNKSRRVIGVDELAHPLPVVYASWKPATTQLHAVHEYDGSQRARWFEPPRILLTCTSDRAIHIWIEANDVQVGSSVPSFVQALRYQPENPLSNVRWVLSKNRNVSEEKFHRTNPTETQQMDWISGVDHNGVLHLYQLLGLYSAKPHVRDTEFQVKVNGEEERKQSFTSLSSFCSGRGVSRSSRGKLVDNVDDGEDDSFQTFIQLKDICVMAYFAQDYFGMPSKFDIVLQRSDGILLSYIVTVSRKDHQAHVKKKSWYRSHVGSITALTAHPSLPLVASVDEHRSEDGSYGGHEILIFWVSFSAFSAESRLIPSGVLRCPRGSGDVLCVHWIPTLHFDATPLLLVAYTSGIIDIYGRAANAADVVNSPRQEGGKPLRRQLSRSPSMTPWTFFDYVTGESGIEYEVARQKDEMDGLGFSVENTEEGGLRVSNDSLRGDKDDEGAMHSGRISVGDEVIGLNNKLLVTTNAGEFQQLIDDIATNDVAVIRFRSTTTKTPAGTHARAGHRRVASGSSNGSSILPAIVEPVSDTTQLNATGDPMDSAINGETDRSVEDHAAALRQSFLESAGGEFYHQPGYVHAGSVKMYGGWRQLLSAKVATSARLVCVSPVYANDGEYIPETVLIFSVTSLPGRLTVWKGVHTNVSHSFHLTPLQILDSSVLKRRDITSIAGERDYRQRAFTHNTDESNKPADGSYSSNQRRGCNSLVFIGDASGSIEHWRCKIIGDTISFTMMSTCQVDGVPMSTTKSGASPVVEKSGSTSSFDSSAFYRRGYCRVTPPESNGRLSQDSGIHHIEVDDPNRIAVLHTGRPDVLHIYEGESGLGILRLDESISSGGRGRILGFCWCPSHVEFNVDALAVHYESSIVIYQYDTSARAWIQVGNDILTSLAIFDCTRDSSALLVGGGHLPTANIDTDEDETESNSSRHDGTEEIPIVLSKWDEPGDLLQTAMDWKAPESPQKLPVWHPYVVITTLFGMHARVGVKDTSLAGDAPAYEFSKAFKDAVQMLKLLVQVMGDDASTRSSARSGVLVYTAPQAQSRDGSPRFGNHEKTRPNETVGRYSTAIHIDTSMNKAELLFATDGVADRRVSSRGLFRGSVHDDSEHTAASTRLEESERATLLSEIDWLLHLSKESHRKNDAKSTNASLLFGAFTSEQLLKLKAVLHFVNAIQSLGFDLDASAADLGAKRYFSMFLFARSLKTVVDDHMTNVTGIPPYAGDDIVRNEKRAYLCEVPSSGVLWALHSNAQQFLWEHCISAQAKWTDIRPMWLGLWVRDVKDLRGIVERLAKSTYARTRDAMDVALFYVALGKANILGALAKISKVESNKKLSIFVENDFTQDRWCNAAIKNAYSLLAKKQYETAAAFFLLCEPPRLQEAIRLLSIRLLDSSLALIVSRLVEYRTSNQFKQDFISSGAEKEITPIGNTTKLLLQNDVIPVFRGRQDRWLESCALWWLEEFDQAGAILSPQSQAIDVHVDKHNRHDVRDVHANHEDILAQHDVRVAHFYVNLTSLPIYFQHLYSCADGPLIQWAIKKVVIKSLSEEHGDLAADRGVANGKVLAAASRTHRFASAADIEHAFSFSAYVCKRHGMSDTSLVEMLQARHLVNLHAKTEIALSQSLDDEESSVPRSSFGNDDEFAKVVDLDSDIDLAVDMPKSPRMMASSFTSRRPSRLQISSASFDNRGPTMTSSSNQRRRWDVSPRRMSELNDMLDFTQLSPMVRNMKTLHRSSTTQWTHLLPPETVTTSTAPWLKAQIADMECRRWSSSAFVGKMIGIRVAREMITHFREELDVCFRHFVRGMPLNVERHRDFLEELCAPLCEQFQVDRKYVLEAALAVMQPHAYLHIAEVCFLLSLLGRAHTVTKWIQYVSLSMLHSCTTFASCRITEDIYRDWESLTIQLCYLLHLDAQDQISLQHDVIAQVGVAVRTGVIFLSWCRHQWEIVHDAISKPFYSRLGEPKKGEDPALYFANLSQFSFDTNLELIRRLQQSSDQESQSAEHVGNEFTSDGGGFGYLFLRTVAAHLHGDDCSFAVMSEPEREVDSSVGGPGLETQESQQPKLQKMYTLILMVSILRTLYARAQVFLIGCQLTQEELSSSAASAGKPMPSEKEELDISSSLFTPRKLWKPWTEAPLDGIRRWYSLIESHLRCEFDYSVKEVTCICGLYGLDGRARTLAPRVEERMSVYERQDLQLEESAASGTSHGSDQSDLTPPLHPNTHHKVRRHSGSGSHRHHSHRSLRLPHVHLPHHHRRELLRLQHELDKYLSALGISLDLHLELVRTSDDYVLVLMQHAKHGVRRSYRRFRVDPRVHVPCFLLKDAFEWLTSTARVFTTVDEARLFLSRCCKQRKLRLLVKRRGQDVHHFPGGNHSPHHRHRRDDRIDGGSDDADNELSAIDSVRALGYQAMMFVDAWEVEAEMNVRRYMHGMGAPLNVELGWERLSPISTTTRDTIAAAVFSDPELLGMWHTTCGEGWLVSSIMEYQLDGVHSHRSGHLQTKCVFEDDQKLPYLVEIHSRSQRNELFKDVGLPHRFVGNIKVKLLSARDLIPVTWIEHFCNPYSFFCLSSTEDHNPTADSWSIQTYRSRCAPGSLNPVWGNAEEDEFVFRFAIPTHRPHVSRTPHRDESVTVPSHAATVDGEHGAGSAAETSNKLLATATRLWNSMESSNSAVDEPVEVLESLFHHAYSGPPLFLHCAMFHKTKVMAHHFMGQGKVALHLLTPGRPIDVWVPLEGVSSGAMHIQIELSFQLMCSSTPAQSASSYDPSQVSYDMMSTRSSIVSNQSNTTTDTASSAQALRMSRAASH